MTGEVELLVLSASATPPGARVADKRSLEQQRTRFMGKFLTVLIAFDIVGGSDSDVLFSPPWRRLSDPCLSCVQWL